jgi:hypothetical protein
LEDCITIHKSFPAQLTVSAALWKMMEIVEIRNLLTTDRQSGRDSAQSNLADWLIDLKETPYVSTVSAPEFIK